ncbi:MAG: hypothetical protein OSA43_01785 [Pirellulales bacterium]|nr:hypothetical protein [Pirellulales bacterium]
MIRKTPFSVPVDHFAKDDPMAAIAQPQIHLTGLKGKGGRSQRMFQLCLLR